MTISLTHALANRRRASRSLVLASSIIALAAALSSCGYGSSSGSSQNANTTPETNTGAADSGTIDSCALLSEDRLSAIIDEGTIDIATWHGSGFFSPGTIGAPRSGIGDEAQDDSDHGVVIFRVREDVVQVHVISPDHKAESVQIASAAADQLAGASRS